LLATDFGIIEEGRMVKQLTAAELDAQCQHHIELKTTDNHKASKLLCTQFGDVVKDATDRLLISDVSISTEDIISMLTAEGIGIKGINPVDQDLESYFMGLIGGTGGNKDA